MMRALGGTASAGFAGIAAQRETNDLRLLRPVLGVAPDRLRATLIEAGMAWIEDPSNRDPRALRARLRALGGGSAALQAAARLAGAARGAEEHRIAAILARRASIFPEGYARLTPGALPPAALAALLRTIAGACYPISAQRVAALAWAPRPATIAGVRLLAGGAGGPGLLLVREAQAQAPPVAAVAGVVWDGRFRLDPPGVAGAMLGGLGSEAARWRRRLPAAVLAALPALRRDGTLIAVPHLGYNPGGEAIPPVRFAPAHPAAGAPWRGDAGRGDLMSYAT